MTSEFRVADATCGHCKATIERTVSGIEGVRGADLNLESKRLMVEHDDSVTSDVVAAAIAENGYTPEVVA